MQKFFVALGLSLALPFAAHADSHVTERHCGWLENPTPANYTLVDQDGTWTIAQQGGYQAKGFDNLPEVDPSQFERTNGNYGRSCACLDVEVDYAARVVNYIAGGEARPLTECRAGNFDDGQAEPAPGPGQVPTPAPVPAPKKNPWVDPQDPVDAPYKKSPGKDYSDRGQRDQKDDRGQRGQKDSDHWYPRGDDTMPPASDAEIQVFMDYHGYNNYAVKYVSNYDQVISAALVYPSGYAQNGACYMGDPDGALRVFQLMVDRMNYEQRRNLTVNGTVFFDGGDTGKPALQIYGVDEYGRGFVWFDRIRRCDRWSTPAERMNRP